MQKVAIVSLVLLGLAAGLEFDAEAAKKRPVTKVITLLKDMLKQLEKEGEEDEEIYDKMACWCETTDKEMTKSIADAEAHIEDLTAAIEAGSAASARLNAEIKNLQKEVAENQETLDKATALRTKQLAEFNAEEKDALQALAALKSAIIVLSKHHGGSSLLQTKSSAHLAQLAEAAAGLRRNLHLNDDVLDEMISPKQKRVLTSFIQAPADFYSSGYKRLRWNMGSFVDEETVQHQHQVPSAGSYAPQSGAIFGILTQMKETFEANLSQSQKEEMENQKAYEDLKAAKEEEIQAGQAAIDKKTEELASTDEKLAADKEDLEGTQASLEADTKFLANMKLTCQSMDQEWELRQKARQEEIEAVTKALAILSSDDAHDLFSKTLGFAQTSASLQTGSNKRRDTASRVLEAAAKKFQNPMLSQLAVRVRLDAFTKVKKAIDDMIAELLKQKQDEIKLKDWCVDEMNTNERTTEMKGRDRDDLNAKIDDLTDTIEKLTRAIESLKAEVAELQVQMKRAGEDREKENKEFQQTISDSDATVQLLNQALNVLKAVYDKKAKKAALAQTGKAASEQAPAPPGFKKYKKSGGAGGVLGMLQQIIDEAKGMKSEAARDEEDAQKAYEDFVKDTNKSIEEKNLEITNKGEEKAKAETDKVEAEEALQATMMDLEVLANEKADLHSQCDFVLKNFEIRQTARDQEVEALRQAKAILSGAKFEEFLQTGKGIPM